MTIGSMIRREIFCRLGWHGSRFGQHGEPVNCCMYCGSVWRPEAWREWDVTLRDGSVHRVLAVNEFHAESRVVYGNQPQRIDHRTGGAIGDIVVHRRNIVSAVLVGGKQSMKLQSSNS